MKLLHKVDHGTNKFGKRCIVPSIHAGPQYLPSYYPNMCSIRSWLALSFWEGVEHIFQKTTYNWIGHRPSFLLKPPSFLHVVGWCFFFTPFSHLSSTALFRSLPALHGSYRRLQIPSFFILHRNLVFFVFLHPLRLCSRNILFFHQKVH